MASFHRNGYTVHIGSDERTSDLKSFFLLSSSIVPCLSVQLTKLKGRNTLKLFNWQSWKFEIPLKVFNLQSWRVEILLKVFNWQSWKSEIPLKLFNWQSWKFEIPLKVFNWQSWKFEIPPKVFNWQSWKVEIPRRKVCNYRRTLHTP